MFNWPFRRRRLNRFLEQEVQWIPFKTTVQITHVTCDIVDQTPEGEAPQKKGIRIPDLQRQTYRSHNPFPSAQPKINSKRLDLFNLYREVVVTRGGFHVGNGINWKGQVFSKDGGTTLKNRMTGVGNTLKKHYETYLVEYDSSTAGDWVNCGEWAQFRCDRRPGLGAFKDYVKADGLERVPKL
ncbi:hypothetical protein IGI04_023520 [Brassica rapa subsp. trilocularis]|uniref:ARID domain-containing protein n=1 Tax=Brassica rapa subsp. trilocularis TaxID=1813537 RepID=A0ABQ7M428_BRACM|nr:hypothetical protein IGI04_023520 [Brassica rapa subsp. trilocularis]